jgi:hypothetical protein
MNDIAKGVHYGGWSLVAGWIVPTAVNVLLFGLFVLPSLHGSGLATLEHVSLGERSAAGAGATVVIGPALSALKVPLYRLLEGYLWPPSVSRWSQRRRLRAKKLLAARLELVSLSQRATPEQPADRARLVQLRSDPRLWPYAKRDLKRTTGQLALLQQRLQRYPVDDSQVAPSRLANAIRRVQEYGYQRYRLDSQALWDELTAAAPKQLSSRIDAARSGVDFFVCLLFGNLGVSAAALSCLGISHAHRLTILVTAGVLIVASPIWYRLAIVMTDDWGLAVRALVNAGRMPLAGALGLKLPRELAREREMWQRYSGFVRTPFQDDRAALLDEFRTDQPSGSSDGSALDASPVVTGQSADPRPYLPAARPDNGHRPGAS